MSREKRKTETNKRRKEWIKKRVGNDKRKRALSERVEVEFRIRGEQKQKKAEEAKTKQRKTDMNWR